MSTIGKQVENARRVRWMNMLGGVLLLASGVADHRVLAWLTHHQGLFGVVNQRILLVVQVLLVALALGVLLLRTRRWAAVAAMWVAVFVACWAAVEVVVYATWNSPEIKETGTPELFRSDPTHGFALKANVAAQCMKITGSDTLFNVRCTTDPLGMRVMGRPAKSQERAMIFLGCSFTFGTGVDDAASLPARYAQLDTLADVFNRGVPGHGPQNTWHYLQANALNELAEFAEPTVVYTLIDGHVPRAVGSMQVYSIWGQDLPYCTLEDGAVRAKGSFTTGRPVRSTLYALLFKSAVIQRSGIDIPLRHPEHALRLTKALLEESAANAQAVAPTSRYVVLLYPGMRTAPWFKQHLDAELIEVVDLSALFDPNEEGWRIPGDPHPSAKAHERVAEALFEFVRNQ